MDKQQKLDNLFAHARTDKQQYSFEDAKSLFSATVASSGSTNSISKKYLSLKNWIFMITSISAITLVTILLTSDFSDKENASVLRETSFENVNENETVKSNKKSTDNIIAFSMSRIEKGIEEMDKTASVLIVEKKMPNELSTPKSNEIDWSKQMLDDEPYQFPVLTEKEIEATKKKKKAMLKALQKHSKDFYAYIPSGTYMYDSTQTSVQAFYMSKTEVTNFEYRTFLFDLLMQDRKDEFLKAKPNQEGWINKYWSASVNYRDYYFSHPAYDDYPVVNISKEGAELYCKWLTAELRKFVGEKKEGNYNDVRLPQRVEWVKAASVEGKQLPYPWNGQFVRNREGLFQANFTRAVADTIASDPNAEEYAGQDITAPVKSFWPNALDLYNMSGNVAEMVYDDGTQKTAGTAGGSWRSTGEEVKIYATDPYPDFKGSAPDIGFRVVSTFLK